MKSLWFQKNKLPKFAPLRGERRVDVAIIGGGITGLTAAYFLQKAGTSVAILERDRLLQGETGRTTAHLTEVVDPRYYQLISDFGLKEAGMVLASHRWAIRQIEELSRDLPISCGFRRVPGYLYTERAEKQEALDKENEALHRLGMSPQLRTSIPLGFSVKGALRLENQAQVHPIRFMTGVLSALASMEVQIFEHSPAHEIQDGEPCRIQSDAGVLIANHVLVVTNQPISNWVLIQTKVAAYRSYAIAAEVVSPPDAEALYWDLEDPYHYIRFQSSPDTHYVILGGEDHKTGQLENTELPFHRLEEYAKSHIPFKRVSHRWSGQIIETVDGLPYIGRNSFSDHVYVATGFSGNGITYGLIAAQILSDEVRGRKNAWADLYSATRIKPIVSAGTYLAENKDFPQEFLMGRLHGSKDLAELAPNDGALVSFDGQKVAVYRSTSGVLTALSPVCPHMKCLVKWNRAEKTWDCPCHGSRFNIEGHVINGPANSDLKKVEVQPAGSEAA